ncbi:MAG: ABC transporter permease [Clostridiaceae bacterium]|nr:ABC transporter permease [Clostridiaceae bacterium]
MDKKLILQRLKKSKFFMFGFTVALLIVLLSLLAPYIVRFDPIKSMLTERLMAPEGLSKGFSGHVLGTDQMGRDILTRLLVGSRYSLAIALCVVVLSAVIGTTLGLIAGYSGKIADTVIMRATDVFLSIPNLVLAIAVMAVLGASTVNLVAVLTITSWVSYCKITRNNVLVVKSQEFVHASQVLGASMPSIIFKQILPNVTTPLLITISQQFGFTIMVEASLSFLNLGIQPPTPSWGNMIAAGRNYLTTCPWMVIAPGVALMLTVLAFNFLGDGLRDVFDPKRT